MFRAHIVDGLPYPKTFPVENYYLMRDLPLRSNDIVLATFPKCGTNWVAYIIWGILHPEDPAPQASRIMFDIPIVERVGLGSWKDCPEDQGRTLATHLPSDRLQKNTTTKYVVVLRNPLDTCVSYYHFLKSLPPIKEDVADIEEGKDLTIDAVFNHFMKGETTFGDFFSHLKSWYDLRKQENVHLLVFEKLKANPKKEILKLAHFLGHEQKLEDNNCQLLDKIVDQSSFSAMKKNLDYSNPVTKTSLPIMRKGESGGYGDTLSTREIEILKEKMEKELAGTEILELWKGI